MPHAGANVSTPAPIEDRPLNGPGNLPKQISAGACRAVRQFAQTVFRRDE